MCMYWLKYVKLDTEVRLKKNMRGTTLEIAMLADVSRPTVQFRVIINV